LWDDPATLLCYLLEAARHVDEARKKQPLVPASHRDDPAMARVNDIMALRQVKKSTACPRYYSLQALQLAAGQT
jgi:hypothetical protein